MENEKASLDPRVTVNLVMHNYTTSVNKNKAIELSNYFSSLLSGNFSDHNLKEHQINYDISIKIFKTYIDWIENAQSENYPTIYSEPEKSLKNVADDYYGLLELLMTSIIFMSEQLTCQLSRIIITRWLDPDKSLDIWNFAQDHGLCTLKDVAFEVCLDRFSELPYLKLMMLPTDKFIELVTNSYINDNTYRRQSLILDFLKLNDDCINPDHKFVLQIADLNTIPKPNSQCFVTYKLNDTEKKQYCVYCLNDRELVELVDFEPMFKYLDGGYEVVGRRIVGRRFSIYMIGGEKGLGTGRFIKSIWRYCLISRTWYYVTELCTPRRHMIAEFLDQNLYLMGGVGNFRVKLSSVAILNVHTNEWHEGEKIPEVFTEIPPSCVSAGRIIYYSTKFYVFNQEKNGWKMIPSYNSEPCYALTGDPVSPEVYSFYSSYQPSLNSSYPNDEIIKIQYSSLAFNYQPNAKNDHTKIFYEKRECSRHIFNKPLLVSFRCTDDKIFIEKRKIDVDPKDINFKVIDSFYQQVDNINTSLFSYQLGCFNIINPDTLYN
ncbi:GSCOCG00000133001-RA-CDS [Cotesia congregata]|nr:GSCOCG00000133001-RA-CDS [Cotesia congregata]